MSYEDQAPVFLREILVRGPYYVVLSQQVVGHLARGILAYRRARRRDSTALRETLAAVLRGLGEQSRASSSVCASNDLVATTSMLNLSSLFELCLT